MIRMVISAGKVGSRSAFTSSFKDLVALSIDVFSAFACLISVCRTYQRA